MISKEEILSKITPKNDIIFKKIFGSKGNEEILKDFLESILDIKIEFLTVEVGTELLPEFLDKKLSGLDVRAKLNNGTFVNIEVQTNMYGYSDKRNLAYWSKAYLEQFKSGDDYSKANKTICIWILDGEVFDIPGYHSTWKIGEGEIGITEHFDDFEIHVIELKKFRQENIIKPKKKEFWLWFIDHTKKELVEMSYSLEEIRKAKAEYEKMLEGNDELRHLLIREKFAEWDRQYLAACAEEEGMEKGMEKGMKKGMEEGMEKGMEKGLKEGEKKAKLEMAKKMLKKCIDIETILEVTGLSKEEIEKISI